MTLMEIANELVAGCREGRELENLDKLYATHAMSVEAQDFGGGRAVKGIEAIKGKHAYWSTMFEPIGGSVSDPYPNGDNQFAVIFEIQTRNRQSGEVTEAKEIALYTVENEEIVKEEFLYPPE